MNNELETLWRDFVDSHFNKMSVPSDTITTSTQQKNGK